MRKKLLILDIDDTMCNASESYEKAIETCYVFFSKKHPSFSRNDFLKMYQEARNEVHLELSGTASMHDRFLYFQRMSELMELPFEPRNLEHITEVYWQSVYENLKLFPGVKETMRKIKESGILIGLATNLVADVQIKKLEKLGVEKYIDFVVTSQEAGKEKPHPSVFLLALKKAGCLPEESVMLGDSKDHDIAGANHLGITSVLFSKDGKGGSGADFTISKFDGILDVLKIV